MIYLPTVKINFYNSNLRKKISSSSGTNFMLKLGRVVTYNSGLLGYDLIKRFLFLSS